MATTRILQNLQIVCSPVLRIHGYPPPHTHESTRAKPHTGRHPIKSISKRLPYMSPGEGQKRPLTPRLSFPLIENLDFDGISGTLHAGRAYRPSRKWESTKRGGCEGMLGGCTLGKRTTLLTPTERASATASKRPCLHPSRSTPGMESIGMFLSPSCMKTGRMRLEGVMKVSEIAPRIVGLRRLRLGLDKMSCKDGPHVLFSGISQKDQTSERTPLRISSHQMIYDCGGQ